MLPQAARIVETQRENANTRTFVFDAHWRARPGQFLMAWLPRFDEKPFSLVDDDPVTITVAAVGPFTRLLHRLEPGDRVWLRGPLGRGFRPEGQRMLLVGGGYGSAPLDFLARRAKNAAITAVIGARTAADLLFVERLARSGADVQVTTEDGSAGEKGLVTAVVEPLLARGGFDALYACGPHGMLAALEALARRHRVPAQLSWEAYMRCGLGLCGSCEHQGRVLCLEGPVLSFNNCSSRGRSFTRHV
ncbi:MAG: dihydroorotate dehydrogenase electron transfer subunit [Chloroflexi bacterium]|nr:dihydroorotate dehydrogenase electron transfer subunit [Chloroflexota bacterium]